MDHIHHGFRSPAVLGSAALDDAVRAATCDSENRLSWESLSATATLVATPDGRPIRTIITGRRHITTGTYASRKAGRALPYESMLERAFFMHSEVDTNVLDYRAQPFRFEFVIAGHKRTYIVDCVRLLGDGSVEVVEVKKDRRALLDPQYALKLEAVRLICERIGWRFRVVLKAALHEPAFRFANVEEIQSWRFTVFDRADEHRVLDMLGRQSSTPLGVLADALSRQDPKGFSEHGRGLGVAKLKAMMVKRIVRFDLSKPLSFETLVELVVDQPEILQ